ncbi:hypothetical protein ASE74_13350 [Pedobacter sp. Leaf216]|uniref:hypothetical protein n=1 Tax=Pedobacter sp. Leaf216 TaxID=1735684 RepID=UPI0006F6D218|nr:hypothetical protein [Pedobacter sp. Leaf216]KQM78484.1 hypothetical protein ASE74_13350 [Pedobacter sp. Leaf216]
MENNQQETTSQTSLPKETELPENADYRGIAGKASLKSEPMASENNALSGEADYNNNETDENPLIRGI